MTEEFTAGSAIKALQEASARICEDDYLRMKVAFILASIGMIEERKDNETV